MSPAPRSPRINLTTRVSAAFRALAGGLGASAAYAQTKAFYRSGGGAWTRALS
jgi:hypothetical protein